MILSLFGFFISCLSLILAFVAFFAPTRIFPFLIRHPNAWKKISTMSQGEQLWRHEWLSGFTIQTDYNNCHCSEFWEDWLEALYRPDESSSSQYVEIKFNGVPIFSEIFVYFDGGRNFIPLPRREKRDVYYTGNDRVRLCYDYDEIQKNLAKLVGYVYLDEVTDVMNAILSSRYNPILNRLRAVFERNESRGDSHGQ